MILEIIVSVILLSILICYSKDFIIRCIKLSKDIKGYKVKDQLNTDVLGEVQNFQFLTAVLSTLAVVAMIFVFKKFTFIVFPVYAVALSMCWYLPLKGAYKSGRIFKDEEVNISYQISSEDHLIYLELGINTDFNHNIEENYWNHYLDEINGEKRSYSVIFGDSKRDIMETFKDFNLKNCNFYDQNHSNYYSPYFKLTYNQQTRNKLKRYFDI